MTYRVGADLGGTYSKAAVVDQEGRVMARFSEPTPRARDPEACVEGLLAAIRRAADWVEARVGRSPEGYGVSVNSPFEHGDVIHLNNNLPALEGFALRSYLRRRLEAPVVLEWDINAALLGELWAGAASGRRRVVMVSIGTGVAAAISVRGQLLRWVYDQTPGEMGHMVVARDGPVCTCGGRGCWEEMVSSRAVLRIAREIAAGGDFPALRALLDGRTALTPEAISRLADTGDPGARAVWQEVGEWLGVGIASLAQIFLPDRVVVGGGISLAGEKLLAPCRASVDRHVGDALRGSFDIVPAALGQDSALVGAASLVSDSPGGPPAR
ncbi:MAG: ROK family protein [Limnochordaceae bacterium]|nr:ROK family protein [Limnochordaceae bacterium]